MDAIDLSGKIIIKTQLGNDIRKMLIHNDELTYDELALMLTRVYKGRLAPNDDLTIKYRDEDGDLITLNDNTDVAFAIQTCKRVLKLTLCVNAEPRPLEDDERVRLRKTLQMIRDEVNHLLDSVEGPSRGRRRDSESELSEEESESVVTTEQTVIHSEAGKEFDPLATPLTPSTDHEVKGQPVQQSNVMNSFGLQSGGDVKGLVPQQASTGYGMAVASTVSSSVNSNASAPYQQQSHVTTSAPYQQSQTTTTASYQQPTAAATASYQSSQTASNASYQQPMYSQSGTGAISSAPPAGGFPQGAPPTQGVPPTQGAPPTQQTYYGQGYQQQQTPASSAAGQAVYPNQSAYQQPQPSSSPATFPVCSTTVRPSATMPTATSATNQDWTSQQHMQPQPGYGQMGGGQTPGAYAYSQPAPPAPSPAAPGGGNPYARAQPQYGARYPQPTGSYPPAPGVPPTGPSY